MNKHSSLENGQLVVAHLKNDNYLIGKYERSSMTMGVWEHSITTPRQVVLRETPAGISFGLAPFGSCFGMMPELRVAIINSEDIFSLRKAPSKLEEVYLKSTTGLVLP